MGEFIQALGTPSVIQTYTVSGSGLENSIKIRPPVNFEVSVHGSDTWKNNISSLYLNEVNGNVDYLMIDVRLNASTPGNYSGNIEHTSNGAEGVNLEVAGMVSGVTGTVEDLGNDQLKVWPNPAANLLNVQVPKSLSDRDEQVISILNNLGILVASFTIKDFSGPSVLNIDQLSGGLYHLEAVSKDDRKVVHFLKL